MGSNNYTFGSNHYTFGQQLHISGPTTRHLGSSHMWYNFFCPFVFCETVLLSTNALLRCGSGSTAPGSLRQPSQQGPDGSRGDARLKFECLVPPKRTNPWCCVRKLRPSKWTLAFFFLLFFLFFFVLFPPFRAVFFFVFFPLAASQLQMAAVDVQGVGGAVIRRSATQPVH